MENSKPSTSYEGSYISRQQRIDLLEKCKACNKTFDDNSILKHITHMDSCKAEYNESELDYIRGWSKKRKNIIILDYYHDNKDSNYLKEQKKSNNKGYWERNKDSISTKRKEKLLIRNGVKEILVFLMQKIEIENETFVIFLETRYDLFD